MRSLNVGSDTWDVMVSKASWGTLSLLFIPQGGGQPRSLVMAEESQFDAERALAGMSDAELAERLQESTPA